MSFLEYIGTGALSLIVIFFLIWIWIWIVDEISVASANKIDKKLEKENEDLKYEVSTLKNKIFFNEKLFQRTAEHCKELEKTIEELKSKESLTSSLEVN